MFVRGEGLRNSQICLSFGAIEGLGKLTNVRPHERQTTKPPAVREENAKTGSEKTPSAIASKKKDLRSLQKDLILLWNEGFSIARKCPIRDERFGTRTSSPLGMKDLA